MKKIFTVLFLLFLSFWTIKPLLHQGFFNVHDNVQVERVFEMGKALKEGQLPVRWVEDLGYGYGYPIFNFYSPLPYYVGGFFNLVGLDAVSATKLMFAFGILLAGLSMFLLARKFWGIWGGLLAAILYLYSPYHALDIYVRGAVDEFWAMGFLPLAFLGMYEVYKDNGFKGIIIGSLGISGVILSHNLTALMLIPFLVLFFGIFFWQSHQKKYFLLNTIYLILLSLALSAFYFLPALWEMRYTNVFSQITGGADFHKNFIELFQIWDFPWGFGGSAGLLSGISFKIGKPNILLMGLAALLFLILSLQKVQRQNNLNNENRLPRSLRSLAMTKDVIFFCLLGFLLSVFLTNQISQPVWELVKPMAFIQYPWRFLELSVFFSSLLSGFILFFLTQIIDKRMIMFITFIIIIIVIAFQAKYFVPQQFSNLNSAYYTSLSHLKWQASKISDEYLPKNFPVPRSEKEVITNKVMTGPLVSIKNLKATSTTISFSVFGDTYSTIRLALANFPGWKVKADGKPILVANSPILIFTLNKGEHEVRAEFNNTLIRSLGNFITLFGIVALGVILAKIKYEKSA